MKRTVFEGHACEQTLVDVAISASARKGARLKYFEITIVTLVASGAEIFEPGPFLSGIFEPGPIPLFYSGWTFSALKMVLQY
ncbi:MAG: hypothetical protein EXR28_03700 [Betaproteobacteria bacterium]|nr:hypothetical protein [Betaproteobacteria bacterium]